MPKKKPKKSDGSLPKSSQADGSLPKAVSAKDGRVKRKRKNRHGKIKARHTGKRRRPYPPQVVHIPIPYLPPNAVLLPYPYPASLPVPHSHPPTYYHPPPPTSFISDDDLPPSSPQPYMCNKTPTNPQFPPHYPSSRSSYNKQHSTAGTQYHNPIHQERALPVPNFPPPSHSSHYSTTPGWSPTKPDYYTHRHYYEIAQTQPYAPPVSQSHLSPHQQRVVAVDCEMVGVLSRTSTKLASALGRCSIVQYDGQVIFDEYIRPEERIIDYRTRWSGIRKSNMTHAMPFQDALWTIHGILQDKIIVGHAIHNDLDVLRYSHPETDIRDTSLYVPARVLAELPPESVPSLKKLSARLLHRTIQTGSHCSVVDARATLDVYKIVEQRWEEEAPENKYVFRKRKRSKSKRQLAKRTHLFNDCYWTSTA